MSGNKYPKTEKRMGSPDQEFNLVWNEFTNFTTETLKDLLQDKCFTDVTLVCNGGRQVGAHKAILSACSPFFRQILLNNPHSNPLIYLQGISYQDLDTIIRFIYLGEAQLPQKDLETFLKASEALKIKGLNTQGKYDTDKEAKCNPPKIKKIKTELVNGYSDIRDNTTCEEAAVTPVVYSEIEDIGNSSLAALETDDPFSSIVKQEALDSYDMSPIDPNKKWFYCDKCDYKASYSVSVKYHHQTVHEGLRFDCDQCDAYFTRKESLKTHKRSIHEGIRYPCDLCDYKATETGALRKHKTSQHGLIGVKFFCHLCAFGAKTDMQLKLHMASKHKSHGPNIKYIPVNNGSQ